MDTPKTNKTVDKFNKKFQSVLKQNLNGHTASGSLQKSIKVTDETSKKGIKIYLDMEEYGVNVDEGRKPGKGMPVENLKRWIVQKGLKFESAGNSKLSTTQKVNSLAFLINRKIKNEGIDATKFIDNALDRLLPTFIKDVTKSLSADMLDDFLKDID